MVGQLMILVLALRLWLLWQRGAGHWRSFVVSKVQLSGAGQMLKFYMSFFRFPLPNWFAYNPLWQMIYPLMLLLVLVAVITGVLHNNASQLLGYSMAELHAGCASLVSLLVLLHIGTAIAQDVKGKGGSISAMLNGNRYFHVGENNASNPPADNGVEIHISVDNIKKRPSDWKNR